LKLLLLLLLLLLFTVEHSISALCSFTLALSADFSHVTYTMQFPLRDPDFLLIRTTRSRNNCIRNES